MSGDDNPARPVCSGWRAASWSSEAALETSQAPAGRAASTAVATRSDFLHWGAVGLFGRTEHESRKRVGDRGFQLRAT